MSIGATRSPEELTAEESAQLKAAHARLREAALAAERFRSQELKPGEDLEPKKIEEMAKVYAAIDSAERELWRLREKLLSWSRPPSAISARESIDWILEDFEQEENV
ncbi:MAG: hypothetical protein ABR507_10345 [Actinomycetota bacterium]|nr:hypothetical protein [Actinomycetota bacterium]